MEHIRKALKECDLFAGLEIPDLQLLETVALLVSYEPGSVILREGDRNNHLYLILEGEVRVTKELIHSSEVMLVCSLSSGDPFGEISFLKDTSATCSVIVSKSCTAVRISRTDILNKLPNGSAILNKIDNNITVIISKKLHNTTTDYIMALRKVLTLLTWRKKIVLMFIASMAFSCFILFFLYLIVSHFTSFHCLF